MNAILDKPVSLKWTVAITVFGSTAAYFIPRPSSNWQISNNQLFITKNIQRIFKFMAIAEFQSIIIISVFIGVIIVIAFDLIDMVLAALIGICALIVAGVFDRQAMLNIFETSDGSVALLFGGMVVARTLRPTGIFDWVSTRFLILTCGSGKRFLLGLLLLVTPLCAILPNATTVVLLAPIIISVAKSLNVDFVGPLILTAIVSNSAGLITLVGDPATFLVGSSIGMTFIQYLRWVSLGGLLSLLVCIPFMPWLLREVWQTRRELPVELAPTPLAQPLLCAMSLLVLGIMVLLFLFGEQISTPIVPPAVAIIGATLGLLVVYGAKVEAVEKVLQDIDWRTLIFLICMFCLVEAFNKTGLLQSVSQYLYSWFGVNLVAVSLFLLAMVGLASSLLANIPIVAAMLLMVKGYMVTAELVPELALASNFNGWPQPVIPVFVAMMFAGTLGGNATLIGASANIISAGICASHGKPVTFMAFARYGLPLAVAQIAVSAIYVLGLIHYMA
jgi:Na+/H+ antiporter NhaD/arsenite permease-like protein